LARRVNVFAAHDFEANAVALSGSLSVAKQLAARFRGSGGLHAICEVIRKLPFVEGNSHVADQLADRLVFRCGLGSYSPRVSRKYRSKR
jgi:hypothetical protein